MCSPTCTNLTNALADNLDGLEVRVGNEEPGLNRPPNIARNALCTFAKTVAYTITATCTTALRGRYVSIQRITGAMSYLFVCELQVS